MCHSYSDFGESTDTVIIKFHSDEIFFDRPVYTVNFAVLYIFV